MKNIIRYSCLVGVFALFWLVPGGFANNPVAVSIDSSALNNPIKDGEYVAPYSANNGQLSLICDDIKDDQYVGVPYNFNVNSYSNIKTGSATNVMFGAAPGAAALYQAAAYLAIQLANNPSQAAYLTFAIWDVFDAAATKTQMLAYGDSVGYGLVQGLVSNALSIAPTEAASYYSNVLVFTPVGCTGDGIAHCTQNGQGVQEFFEVVPEGGSAAAYLFLAGISCFGAMFHSRRPTSMGGIG